MKGLKVEGKMKTKYYQILLLTIFFVNKIFLFNEKEYR